MSLVFLSINLFALLNCIQLFHSELVQLRDKVKGLNKAFTWKEKEKLVEGTSRPGGTCHEWSSVSEGRAGKGQ